MEKLLEMCPIDGERERRRRTEEAQLGSGIGQASGGKMERLGTRGTLATRIGYPVLLPHNLPKHRHLHTRIHAHSSLLFSSLPTLFLLVFFMIHMSMSTGKDMATEMNSLGAGIAQVCWEGNGNRNVHGMDSSEERIAYLLGRKLLQSALIRSEDCTCLLGRKPKEMVTR
jgi:hypothetical protein